MITKFINVVIIIIPYILISTFSCSSNKCIITKDYIVDEMQITSLALAQIDSKEKYKQKYIDMLRNKLQQTIVPTLGIVEFSNIQISTSSLKDTLLINGYLSFNCNLPNYTGLKFNNGIPEVILFIVDFYIEEESEILFSGDRFGGVHKYISYSANYVFWDNKEGIIICYGYAESSSSRDNELFEFSPYTSGVESLSINILDKTPFKKRMSTFDFDQIY